MISKFDGFLSECWQCCLRNNRLAQENRGTPGAEGGVRSRRIPLLQRLHSRSRRGRALPETEHVRSQRRMPIGFRAKRRLGSRARGPREQLANIHRGRVSQQ